MNVAAQQEKEKNEKTEKEERKQSADFKETAGYLSVVLQIEAAFD